MCVRYSLCERVNLFCFRNYFRFYPPPLPQRSKKINFSGIWGLRCFWTRNLIFKIITKVWCSTCNEMTLKEDSCFSFFCWPFVLLFDQSNAETKNFFFWVMSPVEKFGVYSRLVFFGFFIRFAVGSRLESGFTQNWDINRNRYEDQNGALESSLSSPHHPVEKDSICNLKEGGQADKSFLGKLKMCRFRKHMHITHHIREITTK